MTKFSIEAGLKYEAEGQPYLVISKDADKVVAENILNGRREVLSAPEMEIGFLNGKLFAEVKSVPEDDIGISALEMLSERDKAEYQRKCAYLERLIKLTGLVNYKPHITPVVQEVAAELGDTSSPSKTTIYRWVQQWREGGERLAALIPKVGRRGPRGMRLDKQSQKLIDATIEQEFLIREAPTLISVMPDIEGAFEDYNATVDEEDRLQIPSLSSIYRFLKTLDPYEVMVKRRGKNAADAHFRPVGDGIKVDAPLDVVQIDHTVLDVQVIIPGMNIVARPTLTVAFDVCSRMPIGIYVGFASPGYEAVMLCLRSAILPKEGLLKHFPNVEHDWPCYGVPRTLVLDNGMEFHSQHFRDICDTLGMSIVYHPVRQPHYKGHVERFFRSINDGLLSSIPGRTFSDVKAKGDYDAVAESALSFKVFEELLYKWLADVYPGRFHRGLEDYPAKVWEEGVLKYPVDLPVSPDDLLILLCEVKRPTLSNRGVQIDTIKYNSDELNTYYRTLGDPQKVKVKIDPLNIGKIYVFDEVNKAFITVPANDARYEGLTKWQHKHVRKLVNERRNQGYKDYDISKALREIGHHIAEEVSATKKKSHKRFARYLEHDGPGGPNGPHQISHENDAPNPFDFDMEVADVSNIVAAAEGEGWSDLNTTETGQ